MAETWTDKCFSLVALAWCSLHCSPGAQHCSYVIDSGCLENVKGQRVLDTGHIHKRPDSAPEVQHHTQMNVLLSRPQQGQETVTDSVDKYYIKPPTFTLSLLFQVLRGVAFHGKRSQSTLQERRLLFHNFLRVAQQIMRQN